MQRIGNYIQDVRSRTEEEKKRVVFLWTFIFIVIIFFVWVLSFVLSVVNNNAEEARLQAEARQQAMAKAEAALTASSTEEQNGVSNSVKGVIPNMIRIAGDGLDNIYNGFWVVGNMIHK